ncbi:conserved hypothetical protein [Ricinus communis]|uniref:Uncharacterized protein n=1 Tax=Ricinus communis TaxID=3988 RepID=B9SC30_RICCO|nr:conserved hypothetical protein [Ricinus communis]
MAMIGADLMLCCVFDGCLSVQDMEIKRRPYHRNCNCALHNLKGVCPAACFQRRNISFPIKKHSWRDCSLSIAVPGDSSSSKSNPNKALSHQHG